MRSACVLGLVAAAPAVMGLGAPEPQRRILFDSQGRRLAGTTANPVTFGASSFLSVHVGSSDYPYATTGTGIAMPVSVNEYALTGGAVIQSIPLPSVASNGYSACTLAKGVGAWDYNYDGMPQPSGNNGFWMIPCYNVPAGQPITATSPRVIALMASNGIYEVFNNFLPAGGSAPGFRYVASITGFTNYYMAFGQNTSTGIHFLPNRAATVSTQFCAPTYTGCGDELRGLSLYSTYPSYVSGSQQFQLHTADRRRSGLFRAIPSGVITPINTTAGAAVAPWGNYMEPLPAVLNTTEMISAMAFGEDSTRIYLALEDTTITIQGVTSTPKSSGARYYFVAATGTTAARWDQQAVAVISETSPALWSFFPRLRGGGTRAYYSTLDNKLIMLDYSPTPVNTSEIVFADFPVGAKMRAAHLPPVSPLSATPTASGTGSASQTGTPSSSQTGTPSQTQTRTPSASQTRTPSASQTGTPSQTQTGTPSSSQTGTPSSTQTGTPSSSQTRTPSTSQTRTPSSSQTGTPSQTQTGTSSSSQTGTASSSQTQTGTPSSSQTQTPSQSQTGTASSSQTTTPSSSQTGTASQSQTSTASSSATMTMTSSATNTASPTATASVTPSPSGANICPSPTKKMCRCPKPRHHHTPGDDCSASASPTPDASPQWCECPPPRRKIVSTVVSREERWVEWDTRYVHHDDSHHHLPGGFGPGPDRRLTAGEEL